MDRTALCNGQRAAVSSRSPKRTLDRKIRSPPFQVREVVCRRGLDPITDSAAMRRLVDAVPGFGPLQRHLDDPMVEEIWVT